MPCKFKNVLRTFSSPRSQKHLRSFTLSSDLKRSYIKNKVYKRYNLTSTEIPEVLSYMSQRIWNLLEGVILIYEWMALNAAGLNYLGKDKRVS